MQVTRQNNLCLSIAKIQYCKDQVKFFGTTYTTKCHKPTNDRIKAITEMHQPTNVRELQCFLGICNFLSKYSPRMAELSEDLCQLTCKGVQFNWGPEHSETFQALKKELTSAPVPAYYEPIKPVVLQTNASTWGLGAVLIQQNKPIYSALKALQESQKKYVAIELEALAMSWPIEKFHHYLCGQKFTLETDHRPLVSILSKSLL